MTNGKISEDKILQIQAAFSETLHEDPARTKAGWQQLVNLLETPDQTHKVTDILCIGVESLKSYITRGVCPQYDTHRRMAERLSKHLGAEIKRTKPSTKSSAMTHRDSIILTLLMIGRGLETGGSIDVDILSDEETKITPKKIAGGLTADQWQSIINSTENLRGFGRGARLTLTQEKDGIRIQVVVPK